MQKIIINRTGKAPLKFTGELVRCADGEYFGSRQSNRYHTLVLYRTETANKYVVHVEYATCYEGELGYSEVEVCNSSEELAGLLEDYPHCVRRYVSENMDPDGSRTQQIIRQFEALVEELLVGEEFAVTL
jgi:hypothetical protein